jgi:hypothetical protein
MRPHLLLAVALATPLYAPLQPHDFSGTWVATKDVPKGVGAAPSPVFGERFAIKREAATVVLTRMMGRDNTMRVTLPIGGDDVRTRLQGRFCEGDQERIEKIAVEDNALAYTLVGTVPPGATEPRLINVKYLLRPESPDTIAVQGTMVRQGEQQAVATVYRRSSEAMPEPVKPPPSTAAAAPARLAQAAWIGATWVGTLPNGVVVEERWMPPASGAIIGLGRTTRGPQMSSFEFLCIAERDGSLVYAAMPNGRSPATLFTLTGITADSATFENPSHDYPKLIRYTRLPDGSLQTTISAGGDVRAQSFVLKRQ